MAPNNFNEVQNIRGGKGKSIPIQPKGRNNVAVASTSRGNQAATSKLRTKNNEKILIGKFINYIKPIPINIGHMGTKEIPKAVYDKLLKKIKSNKINSEQKIADVMASIGSNGNSRKRFINSIEVLLKTTTKPRKALLQTIISLINAIGARVRKDTQITPSTFITHILQNKVANHNKEKLNEFYRTVNRNTNANNKVSGKESVIEFGVVQESNFFKYMLADIIHDSERHYSQTELNKLRNDIKNILIDTNTPNSSNIYISTIFGNGIRLTLVKGQNKKGKYSKTLVNEAVSKTLIGKIENNSIKITRSSSIPINRNGKNLVRYKILNKKYYKQFNVILNSNKDSVFKNFIHSLLRSNKNRKIGSFLICPSLLINSGVHKTSVQPVEVLKSIINDENIKNIYKFNSKRMNVLLKFPSGNCRLQLLFDPRLKKYYVEINEKTHIYTTTKAKAAASSDPKVKLAKFLGDFMIILKVITESKSKNKPISFATFDNMAALMYLFMCDVAGVKPRLFFTKMTEGERTLYIHGMNDIISNQCSLTTRNARANRIRTTEYLNNSKQNNTTYASNASNSNSNNNNSRTKSSR